MKRPRPRPFEWLRFAGSWEDENQRAKQEQTEIIDEQAEKRHSDIKESVTQSLCSAEKDAELQERALAALIKHPTIVGVTAQPLGAEAIEPAGQEQEASGPVHIDVEPYTIDRENADDATQVRLARWVAWQIWCDGKIPRIEISKIRTKLNLKLKEQKKKNQIPLGLEYEVKMSGITRDTISRLLGKKK